MNQELNVALNDTDYLQTLDPSKIKTGTHYVMLDNLTRRLVRFSESGELENDLAERIDINGNVITVKLRDDIYFSDGTKITSSDVIDSYKRLLAQGSAHVPMEAIFGCTKDSIDSNCSSFNKLDDSNFTMRLNYIPKAIHYFLQMSDMAILHSSQLKRNNLKFSDYKITSGYYFSNLDGDKIKIEKNKFTPDNGEFAIVNLSEYGESNKDIIKKLNEKKVDIVRVPSNYAMLYFEELAKDHLTISSNRFNFIIILLLNARNPKLKRKEIRRRIAEKIYCEFKIANSPFFKKAPLYFFPGTKGYQQESINYKDSSCNSKNDSLNKELSHLKIRIESTNSTYNLCPPGFKDEFTRVFGSNFSFNDKLDYKDKVKYISEKSYDGIINASSMSYHELTEMLNYTYLGSNAKAIDPSGQMKQIINQLGINFDSKKELDLFNKVNIQMFEDSEIIPIAYSASPIVFNHDKIDPSSADFYESFPIWKIKKNSFKLQSL